MKGLRYKLLGAIIAVAPNGGYIAITADKNSPLPMTDKNLSDFIVIHDNRGNMVSSLEMTSIVVGMDFLENQNLLIVL